MTVTQEMQQESLVRARSGGSTANYSAIFQGFMEKGIAADDILPRENVLTFHAWKALGRSVKKGEHGVRVMTWIATEAKPNPDTGKLEGGHKFAKFSTVFHISQTEVK